MESPLAAKFIVGGHTADLESDSDAASPTQQQKTEHKSTNKEGSGIPVSPKTKYRIGQVINSQNPEDAKSDRKIQTKQPAGDPEPEIDGATKKKKKDLRTSLVETDSPRRDMKGSQRKTLENSSQVSWPLESGAAGTYDVYEKIMESKGTAENLQELEAENKMLRQFLKDLNEQLRHHVERAKITNYEGKKSEFRDKAPEEQIKTIIKELANNEKILTYNKEEHRKAESRLNVIKDSGYVFGIQKELVSVQAQINTIKKENKQLGLNTGNVGKDLDMIENIKGIPTNIGEAHEREKEALKIAQRLETLKQKNSACLDEKNRKLEKEKTLSQKITKLERTVFGDSYVSEDTLNRYQKIAKHAAASEEDFKYTQKSCQFKVNQIARSLEDLYMQQQKEREHVEKLEDVLQEQAIALKELIANEGSRLNRGAQEVLDQIRSSLEHEEKQKGDREKERSVTLLKNKSLEAVRALRTDLKMDPVHLNYSSSTKHKNAIKRELEEKKPVWKETSKGDRARMEQNFGVPALKMKSEEAGEFSKPSRPMKVQKEVVTGDNIPSRKKSVAEEPKEEIPKVSKKLEINESDSKAKKSTHSKPESKNGSPREQTIKPSKNSERAPDGVDSMRAKDQEKKEKQSEIKKEEKKEEKKEKKVAKDFFDDLEDIGQLKEEINNYSHQIKQEVDIKEKNYKNSDRKKRAAQPVQKEDADFDAFDNKDEEHEGKVFELGNKKEKIQTNLSKPQKEKQHDNEEKEDSPVKKEKHEGDSKRKEDGHSSVSRSKQQTPQKSKREEKKGDDKEDEGDREWEDNDNFDSKVKKVSKIPARKDTPPKENNIEDNAEFEEFNFDD